MPRLVESRVFYWLLDRVPMRLRTRRPFAQFYWQPSEIEEIKRRAEELRKELGWPDA